jgi:hypothetical protein
LEPGALILPLSQPVIQSFAARLELWLHVEFEAPARLLGVLWPNFLTQLPETHQPQLSPFD